MFQKCNLLAEKRSFPRKIHTTVRTKLCNTFLLKICSRNWLVDKLPAEVSSLSDKSWLQHFSDKWQQSVLYWSTMNFTQILFKYNGAKLENFLPLPLGPQLYIFFSIWTKFLYLFLGCIFQNILPSFRAILFQKLVLLSFRWR